MAMTVEDLDTLGCQREGCTHEAHDKLYLHGGCHPKSAVYVEYVRGSGVVSVLCQTCRKVAARIAVARRAEPA